VKSGAASEEKFKPFLPGSAPPGRKMGKAIAESRTAERDEAAQSDRVSAALSPPA